MARTIPLPQDDSPDDLPAEDEGLSLEELSHTYAQIAMGLHGKADIPYTEDNPPLPEPSGDMSFDPLATEREESPDCPVTPKSILESLLFVGHPQNVPLSAEIICSLMRGVRPNEIDGWVEELNQEYREGSHAMEIVIEKGGYRMQVCSDLHRIRDRMLGKVRETRLNQAAVDCLALVAYQPGITQAELEKQWNHPASSILRMLVRRNLLELRRNPEQRDLPATYFPTERMLNLFGLASLDELPLVEDFES